MPLTKPNLVTFTGVDDTTDFDRMAELSARYPIEWGFLFSAKRMEKRYSGFFRLTEARERNLHTALHLCGAVARSALTTGNYPPRASQVGRVQINAPDDAYGWDNLEKLGQKKPTIRQTRNTTEWPLTPLDVAPLLDCSGGRGISISNWPAFPVAQPVGYAGGLGPDNVASFLTLLCDHPHGFWIDMESGVRTDDEFDLDKCEAVCRKIWGEKA